MAGEQTSRKLTYQILGEATSKGRRQAQAPHLAGGRNVAQRPSAPPIYLNGRTFAEQARALCAALDAAGWGR